MSLLAAPSSSINDDDYSLDDQRLNEDVDAFLQRYRDGAHVLGDPVTRARDDLDSEARLYTQLLEQVQSSDLRAHKQQQQMKGKGKGKGVSSTVALGDERLAEIESSREYVRKMREQTTQFKKVAQARKRLDELRLGIAKREQMIDRLSQVSGEFDYRAHATKEIHELVQAAQADRKELVSLVEDLQEDDSFEALLASLREINYHVEEHIPSKAKFWVICRLDQHQKFETILFACQATKNTPPTSGWIYLGITMRQAAPIQYKRTDHAVSCEPIEVVEEDLRIAHSDNITASFLHYRAGERTSILRMQMAGCSLFSVNGRYMPIQLQFSDSIVYQNPHGWCVMTSYVSTLESFGIKMELDSEESDPAIDTAKPLDFQKLGRRGTVLRGRDTIEQVLYHSDRRTGVLGKQQHNLSLQQGSLQPIVEDEIDDTQSTSQSLPFTEASMGSSVRAQAETNTQVSFNDSGRIEWQASRNVSKESNAAVEVVKRIKEREECLSEVARCAREAERTYLHLVTEVGQEVEVKENASLVQLLLSMDSLRERTVGVIEAIARWAEEQAIAATNHSNTRSTRSVRALPISVIIGVRGRRLYDASPAFRSSNRSAQRSFQPAAYGVEYRYVGVFENKSSAELAFATAVAENKQQVTRATTDARYGVRICHKHYLLRSANVPASLPCEQCKYENQPVAADGQMPDLRASIRAQPFMWNGVNYLSKITTDVGFLATLQVLQSSLQWVCDLEDNPLLLLTKCRPQSASSKRFVDTNSDDAGTVAQSVAQPQAPVSVENGGEFHKTATFRAFIDKGTVCDMQTELEAAVPLKRIEDALRVLQMHLQPSNEQPSEALAGFKMFALSKPDDEQLVLARYSNTGAVLNVPQKRPTPAFRQPGMFARWDVGEFASFQTIGRTVRSFMQSQQLKEEVMAKTMVRKSLAAEIRRQLQLPIWQMDEERLADLLQRTAQNATTGQLESLVRNAKIALDWHAWFVYASVMVQRVWRGYCCRFQLWKAQRDRHLRLIGRELRENAIAKVARQLVNHTFAEATVLASRKISHPLFSKAVNVGRNRMVVQVHSMFHRDVMDGFMQPKDDLCEGCRGKKVSVYSAKHHDEVPTRLPCTCKAGVGEERWLIKLYSSRDSQILKRVMSCSDVQFILSKALQSEKQISQDLMAAVTFTGPLPADSLRPSNLEGSSPRKAWEPIKDLNLANDKEQQSNIRHACMVANMKLKHAQLEEQQVLLQRLLRSAEIAFFEIEDARSSVLRLDCMYDQSKHAIEELLLASQPISFEGTDIMIQRRPWNRLESAAQRKWLKIKGRCEDELPQARQRLEESAMRGNRINKRIVETADAIHALKQNVRRLETVTKRYAVIVKSVSSTATRVRRMVREAMSIVVDNVAVTNTLGSLTERSIVLRQKHHQMLPGSAILLRTVMAFHSPKSTIECSVFKKRFVTTVTYNSSSVTVRPKHLVVALHRLVFNSPRHMEDNIEFSLSLEEVLSILGHVFDVLVLEVGLHSSTNDGRRSRLDRLLAATDPELSAVQREISMRVVKAIQLHPFGGQPYLSFLARRKHAEIMNPVLQSRAVWKLLQLQLASPFSVAWHGKRWLRRAVAVWSVRCAFGCIHINIAASKSVQHFRHKFSFSQIVASCRDNLELLLSYLRCVVLNRYPENVLFEVLQGLQMVLPGQAGRREILGDYPVVELNDRSSTNMSGAETLCTTVRVFRGQVAAVRVCQFPLGMLRVIVSPPINPDQWVLPPYESNELTLDLDMEDVQSIVRCMAQRSQHVDNESASLLHSLLEHLIAGLQIEYIEPEHNIELAHGAVHDSCWAVQHDIRATANQLYSLGVVNAVGREAVEQLLASRAMPMNAPDAKLTIKLFGRHERSEPLTLFEGAASLSGAAQQWVTLRYEPGAQSIIVTSQSGWVSAKAMQASCLAAMQAEDMDAEEAGAICQNDTRTTDDSACHLRRLRILAGVSGCTTDALSGRWVQLHARAEQILHALYKHVCLKANSTGRLKICFELSVDEIDRQGGDLSRDASYSMLPFANEEVRHQFWVEESVDLPTTARTPAPNPSSHQKTVFGFRDMATWRRGNDFTQSQRSVAKREGASRESPLAIGAVNRFGVVTKGWKLLATGDRAMFVHLAYDYCRNQAHVCAYDQLTKQQSAGIVHLEMHSQQQASDGADGCISQLALASKAVVSLIAATLVEEYIQIGSKLAAMHSVKDEPEYLASEQPDLTNCFPTFVPASASDQNASTVATPINVIAARIPSDLNQPIELLHAPGQYWMDELPSLFVRGMSDLKQTDLRREVYLPAICYSERRQCNNQSNDRAGAWLKDWYENNGWRTGRAYLKVRQQLKMPRNMLVEDPALVGDVVMIFREGKADYESLLDWEQHRITEAAMQQRKQAIANMTELFQCKINFLGFVSQVQEFAEAMHTDLALYYRYGLDGPPPETPDYNKVLRVKELLEHASECSAAMECADGIFGFFDTESRIALRTTLLQRRFLEPVQFGCIPRLTHVGQIHCWNAKTCSLVTLYEVVVSHCLNCSFAFANCQVPACGDIRSYVRAECAKYDSEPNYVKNELTRAAVQAHFRHRFGLRMDGRADRFEATLKAMQTASSSPLGNSGPTSTNVQWQSTEAQLTEQVQRLQQAKLEKLGVALAPQAPIQGETHATTSVHEHEPSILLEALGGLLPAAWTIRDLLLRRSVDQILNVILPRVKYDEATPGSSSFNRVLGSRVLHANGSTLRLTTLYGILPSITENFDRNYCRLTELGKLQAGITVVGFDATCSSICSTTLPVPLLEYIWQENPRLMLTLQHEFIFAAECLQPFVKFLLQEASKYFEYSPLNAIRGACLHLRMPTAMDIPPGGTSKHSQQVVGPMESGTEKRSGSRTARLERWKQRSKQF